MIKKWAAWKKKKHNWQPDAADWGVKSVNFLQ